MKRRIIPLLILLLGIPLFATPFTYPVKGVIIDAGHGGEDPGALGAHIQEKAITLAVSQLLAQELEKGGLQVTLTRDGDYFLTLQERVALVAGHDPGVGQGLLFISIHANSSTSPAAQGFEVLIKKSSHWVHFLDAQSSDWQLLRYATATAANLNTSLNRQNLLLASAVNRSMERSFPALVNRGVKEQDLWVLNGAKTPSILVEIGFLSNPTEERMMGERGWQTKMAQAIAQGVFDYLNDY